MCHAASLGRCGSPSHNVMHLFTLPLSSAVRACAGHADAAAAAAHLAAFAGRSPALAAAARRLVAAELLAQEAGNPVQGLPIAGPGPGARDGMPAQATGAAAGAPAGPGAPAKGAAGAAAAQLQAVLAVALRAMGGAERGAPGSALQPAAACRPGAHANGTGTSCSGQTHVGAAAALGAAELPAVQGLRGGMDGRKGINCAAEAGQQLAPAGDGWRDEGRVWVQGAAAAHLARHVLTAPRLPAALTPAARASLASQHNLRACLAALRRFCDPGSSPAHPANPAPDSAPSAGLGAQGWAGDCVGGATQGGAGRGNSIARGLGWVDCVWALGNVLALVVGDMTSKRTKACACLLLT